MESQISYYLAFNCIHKLKSSTVTAILKHFGGDAATAWQHLEQWDEITGMSGQALAEVRYQHQAVDPARLYAEYLASGCGVTWLGADDYPAALTPIYDPPWLLFYHGALPEADRLCLALIGSRRYTPYGGQVAEIFSRDLAYQGAWIVSGMARGIDTICHKGALAAGGKTVAVLGSGLDVIYPKENAALYRSICDHGAVISEFPLGAPALSQNFPRRNRIISGLCRGVVVIEADLKSGTMHTVNHALEQGRDVFAVPGPVTSPCSRGTNQLIRECPAMVMATSAEDIWRRYTDKPMKKMAQKAKVSVTHSGITDQERKILGLILMPRQFDELASSCGLGLTPAALAASLTMLEIRGLVKQLPGKYYQAVVKNIG
jgi:DNA processing protein